MKTCFSLILIMVPTLIFGFMGKPTEMGIATVTGAVASAFINLEKFSSFKGAGFEAELRKVENVVSEAYATLNNLKQVAKPLLEVSLQTLFYSNTMLGLSPERKDEYKQQILKIKDELEIDDGSLAYVAKKISRLNAINLFEEFNALLKQKHSFGLDELKPEWDGWKTEMPPNPVNPNDIVKRLTEEGINMSEDLKDKFTKYEQYYKKEIK
ncbi:hypothetical protein KFF76_09850 [Bacillus subtilis]|uniref:hypothetical protein n=1 Tax=Bacillus subtilis TaxID=1423 RepID=UPI001BAD5D81|nr:hypothetical protein [Bacillus subtilis]QWF76411.1 hypothetical protein KFF76_09850 [Bacillus subtilis]